MADKFDTVHWSILDYVMSVTLGFSGLHELSLGSSFCFLINTGLLDHAHMPSKIHHPICSSLIYFAQDAFAEHFSHMIKVGILPCL